METLRPKHDSRDRLRFNRMLDTRGPVAPNVGLLSKPRPEPDMSLRSLRSIISGQPPATAEKTATVLEAAILMKEKSKGALLVCDGTRLTGIFTERDALFRVIAAGRDAATTTLGDVMTPQPMTMHPDEPFIKALRLMHT